MKLDLNCDLGEGESPARTRALMRWITSANVACGGHAGSLKTMEVCIRWAKRYHVCLGAHPGPWSRTDFGRGAVTLSPDALELLLLQQVGALERLARWHHVRLHHIKLHGALYHATENNPALAQRYVRVIKTWWPAVKIYALAHGRVVGLAKRLGLSVWEEAFLDRAYQSDGSLVPRSQPNSMLVTGTQIAERVRSLVTQHEIKTLSGQRLRLCPQTLCLHSDTARAPYLAKKVAQLLAD
jgi:5-oxoprolinase (ATP-hydrolysing) subunit A